MSVDIKSMFESIRESLNTEKQTNTAYKDILRMEPGNTYIVRLIPNVKDPKATFFHYYHHGWTSLATGQYVDAICPTTFNERCPICESRFKLYKTKTEDDKKLAYNIRRLEKHLVNVFVVSDPTTPDNEGTIKILRCGKRIYEKIQAAIDGDDAEEFGPKVFDLTEKGCNFKIKVESSSEGNKKFANYNNSRFTAASAIDGMTAGKIQEIYNGIFDLSARITSSTANDMKEMLNAHLFATGDVKTESAEKTKTDSSSAPVVEDDLPFDPVTSPEPEAAEPEHKTPATASTDNKDNDAKIKELLDDIDSL